MTAYSFVCLYCGTKYVDFPTTCHQCGAQGVESISDVPYSEQKRERYESSGSTSSGSSLFVLPFVPARDYGYAPQIPSPMYYDELDLSKPESRNWIHRFVDWILNSPEGP